jgi:hypothetical protein
MTDCDFIHGRKRVQRVLVVERDDLIGAERAAANCFFSTPAMTLAPSSSAVNTAERSTPPSASHERRLPSLDLACDRNQLVSRSRNEG